MTKPPPQDWSVLARRTVAELRSIGLHAWNKPSVEEFGGRVLMLFPFDWYPHIPVEFPIVFISGREGFFDPDATSDDQRYGCLAYGVLAVDAAGLM